MGETSRSRLHRAAPHRRHLAPRARSRRCTAPACVRMRRASSTGQCARGRDGRTGAVGAAAVARTGDQPREKRRHRAGRARGAGHAPSPVRTAVRRRPIAVRRSRPAAGARRSRPIRRRARPPSGCSSQTDGAIARTTLLQAASLPDQPTRSASMPTQRWTFEVPFVTPQGTGIAQFEVSRDGQAAKSGSQACDLARALLARSRADGAGACAWSRSPASARASRSGPSARDRGAAERAMPRC